METADVPKFVDGVDELKSQPGDYVATFGDVRRHLQYELPEYFGTLPGKVFAGLALFTIGAVLGFSNWRNRS